MLPLLAFPAQLVWDKFRPVPGFSLANKSASVAFSRLHRNPKARDWDEGSVDYDVIASLA